MNTAQANTLVRAKLIGWVNVNATTSLRYEKGVPVRARTFAKNFDIAEDNVAQWHGEPLDFGEWKEVNIFDRQFNSAYEASVTVPE